MAFAAMGDGKRAWELAGIINPVRHGDSPEAAAVYMIEPYVLAADVYGVAPHEGRGGWSWYTGAAGWMYRLILESLLGLSVRDGVLVAAPLLPEGWDEVALVYRHKDTTYTLVLKRNPEGDGQPRTTLDGTVVADGKIPLTDDGLAHTVVVAV